MSTIESRLDTGSDDFKANAAHMRDLVEDLERTVARAMQGGGEAAQARHRGRGKLLVRERIDAPMTTQAREVDGAVLINVWGEEWRIFREHYLVPVGAADHLYRPSMIP